MALAVENVLQSNLTLVGVKLVNTPQEREAFRKGVDTEVVTTEASLVGSDEVIERIHNLSRDRITVVSTPDRTVIVREYPAKNDLERLAQVAAMAIENTNLDGQELRAIGYNIELVCESDSKNLAIEYLAEHLFMPHLLKGDDSRLSGGAGRLFFEKSGRKWQARLEPRFNDETTTKIFASLNLHHSEASLSFPTEDDIRDSLTLVWDEVHDLLIHLDGSST
jgi:hypothetical protein